MVQQSYSTVVHRTSRKSFQMYSFYAAPSRVGEGSLQRTKSRPRWQSNFGRYDIQHQLETVRTRIPNGNIKRELQEKSPTFLSQSLISENGKLSGWQFGATPYFGARYPCPTMSFISRRYSQDLNTCSFPRASPVATRLEQTDTSLGKPKGLSGEGTRTTTGLSDNGHATFGRLLSDSEPLTNLPEPKTEQFPQGQREALESINMAINNSAKTGPEYRERRRRNNLSAKKSRDARKFRELQMGRKLVYLEHENIRLRADIYASQEENFRLKRILSANCDVFSSQQFLTEKQEN
ncbi:cell death specification protein 2-like [Orbicella faveolata]|uniref:cell death specification protein 2-like n=2 Tax=Orbicella faveolata TaxID=48498 RepID=UPI0009E5A969|nr:cell death specification protein 2-like [Orbicella faveolata]